MSLAGSISIRMKVGGSGRCCGLVGLTRTVYNHVLRLDLNRKEWELIDNYGDIPCVRMGKFSS
jgi:hypothetical protein